MHRLHCFVFAVFLLTATGSSQEQGILLFQSGNKEDIEAKMNAAADDGYRFAAVEYRSDSGGLKKAQILVFMQKSPDTAGNVRYRVLRRSRFRKLEEDMSEAAKGGYRLVSTTSSGTSQATSVAVILERSASASE